MNLVQSLDKVTWKIGAEVSSREHFQRVSFDLLIGYVVMCRSLFVDIASGVLQGVAGCCRVLQGVAKCCSAM